MAILPPASSSLPSSSEGICCSTSYGITSNSIKLPIDDRRWHDLASTRCKSLFFGSPHLLWLSTGHDLCLSKVNVATDYSDSIPDSSDPMDEQGYHPLEELKGSDDVRPARLSPAEIAKTTVEANKSALLVFPGMVHCEPHDQISWAEFQYHIDDVGDIYFEISDVANPLADLGATNPVGDSLGVDVRVLSGAEVKTHRFSFKVQAANANAAEKQIWQLLFGLSAKEEYEVAECQHYLSIYFLTSPLAL